MAKCNECKNSFGFLELKDGICRDCRKKLNPPCSLCGKSFRPEELDNGICFECKRKKEAEQIPVITDQQFAGKRIVKTLGLVRGATVRARFLLMDIIASYKDDWGGEIVTYTELLTLARDEALTRMKSEAANKGANAVTSVRFSTSEIQQGAAEVVAYGTAVVVEDVENP